MADFTNIDGIYAKDTELRNGISELRGDILSQTIKPLSITKNGTYTADPTVGAYGYSPITVDAVEEPWEPLEDGYSNFWFELTNDTLSPWLNFSAKNNDAVIDWGDGSGEQSLTTLTPTHTYAKAGRYIVKVKGVIGIASPTLSSNIVYNNVLKNVELNNDVTLIDSYAFQTNVGLENIIGNNLTTIYSRAFDYCGSLKNAQFNNYSGTGYGSYSFEDCVNLRKFTVGNNVTKLDNGLFYNCVSLTEIHFLPTAPPTLGSNVFQKVPNSWIGYVPIGYGDTYKSAAGWSSYASHILEEVQTPTRAMVAKFNSNNTDNEEMR